MKKILKTIWDELTMPIPGTGMVMIYFGTKQNRVLIYMIGKLLVCGI
jgi:hypothetical protein